MKNFIIIVVSIFMLSCNKAPKNTTYLNEISFEWTGDIDKPLYKLILCVYCISEKEFLTRKIKIPEESMQKIEAISFDNEHLKIDENNKEVVIQKLKQIDKILDNDFLSAEDREDVKIFIKRIS